MIAKFKKNKKQREGENIFLSTLIGLLVLLIIGFLIFQNIKISLKKNRLTAEVENLKRQIEELERKNQSLKAGISQAKDEEYIEKIAREELNLKKEREKTVAFVLPDNKNLKEKKKDSGWFPKRWWEWFIKKITNKK